MVMMLEMLSDEVLAECAKQRTQEALAVLLGRYADTVYDVVQTLSGGSREADQLTYETLTSTVSWSQELDGNFRIWLFRTAVQNSIDAARRRRPTLFDLSHLAGRLRQALHG
ncbi:MAG TPA: sigma factor, partial [Myxococcaceae bacterium]|nr:sigma factor [Myxococcaceae bacterium]